MSLTTDEIRSLSRSATQITYSNYGYNNDGELVQIGLIPESGAEWAMSGCMVGAPLILGRQQIKTAQQGMNMQEWKTKSILDKYKLGYQSAKYTCTHPGNYVRLEDTNKKIIELEKIMRKNTPKVPADCKLSTKQQALFDNLCKAKNQAEFDRLAKGHVYNSLCKKLEKADANECIKLKNIGKYNELYGGILNQYKKLQTQLYGQKPVNSKKFQELDQQFREAKVKENKWIRDGGKIGTSKKGFGKKVSGYFKKIAEKMPKFLRATSRFAGVAGGIMVGIFGLFEAGMAIMDTRKEAPEGEKGKYAWKQVGKSALRFALQTGSAMLCEFACGALFQMLIPIPGVGLLIGKAIGSWIGYEIGRKIADKIPYTATTVADDLRKEKSEQETKQIKTAIKNNDIQTMAEFVASNKEQVMENGQPKVDEYNNPVTRTKIISQNEEEQKAFEKHVANLEQHVEKEYFKQQEMAQRQAQLEQQLNDPGAYIQQQQQKPTAQYDFTQSQYYNPYAAYGQNPNWLTPTQISNPYQILLEGGSFDGLNSLGGTNPFGSTTSFFDTTSLNTSSLGTTPFDTTSSGTTYPPLGSIYGGSGFTGFNIAA